jgi:hypothetical protein
VTQGFRVRQRAYVRNVKLVTNTPSPALAHVAPPWRTLVLICTKCHGARKGPGPKDVRKCLKKQLGKPDDLRVAEVECLKVCPDDAVTVCIVGAAQQEPELCLISSERDTELLTERLKRRD